MKILKIFFVVFIIVFSHSLFSQNTSHYFHLKSTELSADHSDLQLLDDYFKNAIVIGMGESTHGTHEFSSMRLRFFEYLVEKHQFNTLFLEASFANCIGINEYINSNGPVDDSLARKVVFENGVWPWSTHEMVDVVNWMKRFNLEHPDNKLSFIGADVDVNSFDTSTRKLTEILSSNEIPFQETLFVQNTTKGSRNEVLEELKQVDKSKFNEIDLLLYDELLIQLEFIVFNANNPNTHFYRDKKMGENIYNYISKQSARKGLFWAHNAHVLKFSKNPVASNNWKGTAGGYLEDNLGDKYLSIGQDFNSGTFNAYVPRFLLDTNSKESQQMYLSTITVGESRGNSISAFYRYINGSVFIDQSFIPRELSSGKYFLMNSIGAVYRGDKIGSNYRYQKVRKNSFDVIIMIGESTPTQLILD